MYVASVGTNRCVVDPQAANPFWMSNREKSLLIKVLPFLLSMWIIWLLGFKIGISPYGDEGGYHDGGVLLAQSLSAGTFIQDAFNADLFKYPGYYGFAGLVYSIFGEHQQLLRALGLLPFIGLVLTLANISALIGGERARNVALLLALFSPTFFFFSLQLYRDIYIIFAVSLILHRLVAVTQLGLARKEFVKSYVIFAFVLIILFRSPQALLILAAIVTSLVFIHAASFAPRQRRWVYGLTVFALGVSVWLAQGIISEIIHETFFRHFAKEDQYSIGHYGALSQFSFTSADEIMRAFLNPVFVIKALILKFTGFALGSHPFAQSEATTTLFDLFGDYDPIDWGGYLWEDTLLIYGLQWVFHFLLLPYLVAGFFGLWRYNRKALIALGMLWGIFAAVTLFTANEIRWGLPGMLVYYVMVAVGVAWFSGRINQILLLSISMFISIIAVRILFFPIPMILIPLVILVLFWWWSPQPRCRNNAGVS